MTRNVVVLMLSCLLGGSLGGGWGAGLSAWSAEAPPSRLVVYSANGKFYAVSDPHDDQTTVYSIKQNMQDKQKLWTYDGVFRNFYVSENGQVLATMPREWNRVLVKDLTKDGIKDAIAVVFHHADGKSVDLHLDRILKDPKKLKPSDFKDEYSWGTIIGFDEDSNLVIDTLERHRCVVNPKTGTLVSDEDHNAKN